jgi:asparagine N-glycosylation enzyme membrane subunit Stt3
VFTIGSPALLRFVSVIAAFAVGLLMRSSRYFDVFTPEGRVLLGFDDALFAARRGLYSFTKFPEVLSFDSFIGYPDGAASPAPPLFGWAMAAVARLFGDDTLTFETVAAWTSPLLASLMVWPAYSIGRSVASPAVGLGAAWLAAILPSGILITSIGNSDHHAAVALIASCWLASSVAIVGHSGRGLAVFATLQAVAMALMAFTWSGSLLYIALGGGAQLGAILLLHGGSKRLYALGASAGLATLALLPWLLEAPAPLGGALSSQTLSWLHALTLLCLATLAVGLGAWEGARKSRGAGTRMLRALALASALALPLLLAPSIQQEFERGLDFLVKQDSWAASNPEQLPLFHSQSSTTARSAITRLGLFAYLVPLLPFYLVVRTLRARGRERERILVLTLWVSALSLLLLSQIRYGTDFTTPGSVAFAMLLADVQRGLATRLRPSLANWLTLALAVGMLSPPIQGFHQPRVRHLTTRWLQPDIPDSREHLSRAETLLRFGEIIREATPPVSGFFDTTVRPEYGILVPPTLGHAFVYHARRPVVSNNLGPYLDPEKLRLTLDFYTASNERQAVAAVEALGIRYVVTRQTTPSPGSFESALHESHGSSHLGKTTSGRFRLVAMGPNQGTPLASHRAAARRGKSAVYKLFEKVQGAELRAEGAPRSLAIATMALQPEQGPPFLFRAAAYADESGVARLRVPYPSKGSASVRSSGPYHVRVGDEQFSYEVDERDVLEGREVLPMASPAQPQP